MLQDALFYHQLSMNVVPIGEEKRPITTWAKWQDQRQSEGDVRRMPWGLASGIGIVCGDVSLGAICIDFDHPTSSHPYLTLLHILGMEAYPWVVSTRSGGFHVWVRSNLDITRVDRRGIEAEHIEIRGNRHMAIVPPTTGYAFLHGKPTSPPAVIDPDLLMKAYHAITIPPPPPPDPHPGYTPQDGIRFLERQSRVVASTPPGNRNNQLNKSAFLAGILVRQGALDPHLVISQLLKAAAQCGLGYAESIRTIQSGLQAGITKGGQLWNAHRAGRM